MDDDDAVGYDYATARLSYERIWMRALTTFLGWAPEEVKTWSSRQEGGLRGAEPYRLFYHEDPWWYILPLIIRPTWIGKRDSRECHKFEERAVESIQLGGGPPTTSPSSTGRARSVVWNTS